MVTPSRRATASIVEPCRTVESSTAKNTMLKNSSDWGTSAITGKIASTTGTAPRRPAQPSSPFSRASRPLPHVVASIATGRATKTTTSASSEPFHATWSRSAGNTSRPRVRNIASCATQARPSWNAVTVRLAGRLAEPIARPARYTARKPEPPSVSAAPKASAAVASDATGYSPGVERRTAGTRASPASRGHAREQAEPELLGEQPAMSPMP